MSNPIALTKRVDQAHLGLELTAAGVTTGLSITNTHILCSGPIWNGMDEGQREAELALIAATVANHQPSTLTEAQLSVAPHERTFLQECMALPAITNLSIEYPSAYPGKVVIFHNSLNSANKNSLVQIALAHDPSAAAYLSVSASSTIVVNANGVSTGVVTVTDSRGAAASGKTVRLRVIGSVSVQVDADAFVLDGAGQASMTFGPSTTITGEVGLEVYYESNEADPASFKVRFGTP